MVSKELIKEVLARVNKTRLAESRAENRKYIPVNFGDLTDNLGNIKTYLCGCGKFIEVEDDLMCTNCLRKYPNGKLIIEDAEIEEAGEKNNEEEEEIISNKWWRNNGF